jgi:hypothetical protein
MSSPALFWKSQDMQMGGINFNDALGMAQKVMKDLGLTSVKKGKSDVSGRTPNSHSAVTFFHFGESWIAVIMSAGDEANTVLKKLSDGLDKLVSL